MKKRLFTGVGTALITPFNAERKIDHKALEWLIEMQIAGGIDYLVPCGTTGESPTLSHEEHDEVVASVVSQANRSVAVLAGTGSNSTDEAVRLTRAAQKCGADGALVVSPYYNKPTQKGIILHYREIAKVGLPVVLYDIPGRCGGEGVSAETILELAHEGTICGLKWASGNLEQLQKVLAGRPESFTILSGDDNRTFELMSLGGDGVISVLSNLEPEEICTLVHDMKNDFQAHAKLRHERLLPLMQAMFIETNPIPVKTAMAMRWPYIFQETFRLPLCEMEEDNRTKLKEVLQTYRLLPK